MGYDDDPPLDLLHRYLDDLRAVLVLDPTTASDQLMQLHQLGVRDLRLSLAGSVHDIGSGAVHTTSIETLIELAWHCEFHHDQGRLGEVLDQISIERFKEFSCKKRSHSVSSRSG